MLKVIVVEDEPVVRRELTLLTPWDDMGLILAGEAGTGLRVSTLPGASNPISY